MAKSESITVQILKQIRDEVASVRTEVAGVRTEVNGLKTELRSELESVRGEVRETNARVDALARRQTETEVRLATEIIAVAQAVHGVRDLLRERLDDRQRVDDHERRIAVLERKSA